MSSIPENLYEAAALEGAGKVKQFFMITLPLIWNNIRTTLTFFVISTINLSLSLIHIWDSYYSIYKVADDQLLVSKMYSDNMGKLENSLINSVVYILSLIHI